MIYKQQSSLQGLKSKVFFASLFTTTIPFVLFGWAALTLSAGNTSVLNATTPMFGAIVAYFWLKDKLSLFAILGLCVGFIGVYFLMLDKLNTPASNVLLPTLAVMLASLCYGFSANYTKRYLSEVKPLALATGCQISATLVLLPLSLASIPNKMPSMPAVTSVIIIGIICTGFAYILFFRLIAALGPTKAISVTYLIPVFGLFWGVIFLNEQISAAMVFGCILIRTGVAMTTGLIKRRKRITA